MTCQIENDYIELYKLIKVLDLVDSGAEAKHLVGSGAVYRNGECETRKRAKILPGEEISIGEVRIRVEQKKAVS